jgi:hypothetical protein
MRLVTTINELKEKIFIFDAGLDDRVVELFKMLALSKMKADDASQIPDELRFSKMETVDGEEKMFFAAFSDEQYLGVLELPYALYQSCLITGEPIWDSPIHECGMVDQKWILDRLQSGVTENAESECDSCCDGDCDCCGK